MRNITRGNGRADGPTSGWSRSAHLRDLTVYSVDQPLSVMATGDVGDGSGYSNLIRLIIGCICFNSASLNLLKIRDETQ